MMTTKEPEKKPVPMAPGHTNPIYETDKSPDVNQEAE
jgi:hypothetical protein